jgi:hypothetical protein
VFTTEFGELCDPATLCVRSRWRSGGPPRCRAAHSAPLGGLGAAVQRCATQGGVRHARHASASITGDVYGHDYPDGSRRAVDTLSACLDA